MAQAHDFRKPGECTCNGERSCPICDGGLSWCKVCNGVEGQLTTHCPGEKVDEDTLDRVHRGEIDFVDGAWVEPKVFSAPPASPHENEGDRP